MELSPEKKIAGVLAPLFALRRQNDLGIGDVATLREFIQWAVEVGFRVVQMLPINETGRDNSPYNAISAMAIEPSTLHLAPGSPTELTGEDFESVTTAADLERLRRGPVKYATVRKLKQQLLERSFKSFQAKPKAPRRSLFEQFCQRQANLPKSAALP